MDNNIEMTIIMPSYNRGEYIAEAIESVLMQKVKFKYKLIIADDGSTDDSLEIVEKYRVKNINVIEVLPSKQNQGLLPNCIRVYENMKTKYFCVLDADDYWVDDRFLQKAYDFFEINPQYTIYGSNAKVLKDGIFSEVLYHSNCEKEMTIKAVDELYSGKWKYVTQTSETVFRNVIFAEEVPKIMKDSVGTLSEASFRGDTDRYMLHLKYGYAKFVNEVVSVYRQHNKGIWTSATDLHKHLMSSRAHIDYNRFYDNIYKNNFYKSAYAALIKAIGDLFIMAIEHQMKRISDEDVENLKGLIEKFKIDENKNEYGYDNNLVEWIKNSDNRALVVWGTGAAAERLIDKYLDSKNVLYYIDGNKEKQGKYINSIKVLSPDQLKDITERKYVVIASSYYNDIIESIIQQNLCGEDEIVNLYKADYKYSNIFEHRW